MTDEPPPAHPTSVAVWGVPSPVVAGSRFTVTVGVKCAAARRLAGQSVVIRDETGRDVGHGTLGAEPKAGTRALYAAAVTLTAPREPGVHTWAAAFPAGGERGPAAATGEPAAAVPHREAASAPQHEAPSAPGDAPPAPAEVASAPRPEAGSVQPGESAAVARHEASAARAEGAASATRHEPAACTFSFRTVEPPENAVTVTVVDRDTEAPLGNAEVHLGVYRAKTDAHGTARVEVPAGEYELYVRSPGYTPYTKPVTVTGDAALRVAAVRVSDADFDDDQVWM